MTDRDINDQVVKQLTAILSVFRTYRYPSDLVVKCIAIDPMRPGEVEMMHSGMARLPDTGMEQAAAVLHAAGIDFLPSLDAGYQDGVLSWAEPKRPDAMVWAMLGAAPWFIRWLLRTGRFNPSVLHCIQTAVDWQESAGGRFVFRGEDDLYPEVASGIARRYETSDPDVIASISQRSVADARKFVGHDRDGVDIRADVQHLGGMTNDIDFSRNIWVAMYFATGGDEGHCGRVWALDTTKAGSTGTRITQRPSSDTISATRMRNQSGLLVENPSGVIPRDALREAVRLPGPTKVSIRSFLESIGIGHSVLFPDILAHMDEENTVSLEELVKMWLDALRQGRSDRVADESARLLGMVDADNPHPDRVACGAYCGSLAAAMEGDIPGSRRLMQRAVDVLGRSKRLPSVMRYNRKVVRAGGSPNHMKERLQLLPFEELWCLRLGGYSSKSVPSTEDASAVWRKQESLQTGTGRQAKPGWISTRETAESLAIGGGAVRLGDIRPGTAGVIDVTRPR